MFEIPESLLQPPSGVRPSSWARLSKGERIRFASRERLAEPPDLKEALRLLPLWARYGPEHGLRDDWFDEDGFLLSQYRPGGELHHEFALWRRWHRLICWRHYHAVKSVKALYSRFKTQISVAGFTLAFIIATLFTPSLSNAWPSVPRLVLKISVFLSVIATILVLVLVGSYALAKFIERSTLRSLHRFRRAA